MARPRMVENVAEPSPIDSLRAYPAHFEMLQLVRDFWAEARKRVQGFAV